MNTFESVEFVVRTDLLTDHPRPIVAVDGSIPGADVCFDHHVTGEPVNLDVIPEEPPLPASIATTMLDTDAVISAAVVLLRAAREHAQVTKAWPTLYEAAHFCDHLTPSGRNPHAEHSGLGLHCWLKERGFAMSELLAWAADELSPSGPGFRADPSPSSRSRVFRELTFAVLSGIRRGALPGDFAYLDRLDRMEATARAAVRCVEGQVTLLELDQYIDPLAVYRVVSTDLTVLMDVIAEGAYRYSLGVHPKAYGRVDLRPMLEYLSSREPGWGGRTNAGGSPRDAGSRIPPHDLVRILNRLVTSAGKVLELE
jgi:hypothetical protein